MAERHDARGIAYRDWPTADRQMWADLTREGDIFDGTGPFAGKRPATLETWRNSYGFFLGHLARQGVDLDVDGPADRATLERLRSFAASIAELAPGTQACYFAGLQATLTKAFPARDWSRLRAAKCSLERRAKRAGRVRDISQTPTGDVLLDLGLSMIAEARREAGPLDIGAAELWRDGVMIAFLAAHPIRISDFALLEIGETFRSAGSGYRVVIPGEQSKNHRPYDFSVAPVIAEELGLYLDQCRLLFPGGGAAGAGRLWLARHGDPWRHKSAGRRISKNTEGRLGIRVRPHQFRNAAATTLEVTEGSDARIAKALLTHVTPNLAEKVYSQATQLDASRRYGKVVDGLRREAIRERRRR